MFRPIDPDAYAEISAAGRRPLFTLGPFSFEDAMDGEGGLHHVVREMDEEERAYLADQRTMYEMAARYLAGEYEKATYHLDQSPGHHSLLDLLELAAARARSGDTEFELSELDGQTEEILELDEEDESEEE